MSKLGLLWLLLGWIAAIAPATAQTRRGAIQAEPSVQCQLIGGRCVCGSPGYTGRNIPCRPEFSGQAQPPQSCIYQVDPARIQSMLAARPNVCSRYGPDLIICQAADGTQCDVPPERRAVVQEDARAWRDWCLEYRRVLEEALTGPLDRQFSGTGVQLMANLNLGFYNPAYNKGPDLRNQMNRTRGGKEATIVGNEQIIVIAAKPALGHGSYYPEQAETISAFNQQVTSLVKQFVVQVPGYPPNSRISYFTRPLTINLNDPGLRANGQGLKFASCDKFLQDLERDPATTKR